MNILFLGYMLLDFVNNDGEPVKGLKMFFAHDSEKRNFHGLEPESYFVDFIRDKLLYDMVLKCKPLTRYGVDLIPSFSGKTKIRSIGEVQ